MENEKTESHRPCERCGYEVAQHSDRQGKQLCRQCEKELEKRFYWKKNFNN